MGKYFKSCIFRKEINLAKPSSEFFQYALADIGVADLQNVYIMGDSLTSDIQGGINSGIKTILFNAENKQIKDIRPDYEVKITVNENLSLNYLSKI